MKPPEIFIIAKNSYLLACKGIEAMLAPLNTFTVKILTPKELHQKTTPLEFLILLDEAVAWKDLAKLLKWNHLLLLYTSFFELTQAHIFNLPLKPDGIWHLRDITPSSFLQLFDLVKEKTPVHSQQIIKRLQLPPLSLSPENYLLLKLLAEGKRSTEISVQMHLSKSSIERRKRYLKEQLGIENATDCGLFKVLLQYGYSFYKLY